MLADRVAALVGEPVARVQELGSGGISGGYRAVLASGRTLFVKARADAPEDFFAAEAAGLRWLAEVAPSLVVPLVAFDRDQLAVEWVEQAAPTVASARAFGAALAALHRVPASGFGAPWPGYIGPLPLDNTPAEDWPTFYAERRVAPYLRLLVDEGGVTAASLRPVEEVLARLPTLAGPVEPPARIHGDLWGGNVLWVDGGARLIDPAAHGGHRETDLAMLALFGVSHLDDVLAAYDEALPLADGWRERVPLHQLHPLLVHAVLFGAGYAARAVRAARAALALATG